MIVDPWERDPGGLHVCMKLVKISKPYNGGQEVELKFLLSPCHGLRGGELLLLIPAGDASRYMLGDEYSIRMRSI